MCREEDNQEHNQHMRYTCDSPCHCTRADAGLDRTRPSGGQSTGEEEERDRYQQDYALD
jgi:hypothetical protein